MPTQGLQGGEEIVRAYMGLGVGQDLLRRAAGGQRLQDEAVAGVLGAGVQLAVGKGPGAAFPELDVAAGVQLPGGPEPLHIGPALLHGPAPLQQDGPQAGPGQHQGGEQSGRSRAHHHWWMLRRRRRRRQEVAGPPDQPGDLFAAAAAQDRRLVLDLRLYGVDHRHFLPGVDAAAQYPQVDQVLFPHLRQAGGLCGQLGHVGAGGQFDIFDLQQGRCSFQGACGRCPLHIKTYHTIVFPAGKQRDSQMVQKTFRHF